MPHRDLKEAATQPYMHTHSRLLNAQNTQKHAGTGVPKAQGTRDSFKNEYINIIQGHISGQNSHTRFSPLKSTLLRNETSEEHGC